MFRAMIESWRARRIPGDTKIEVCHACGKASSWQGVDPRKYAAIRGKAVNVSSLRREGRESSRYWVSAAARHW